MKIVYAFYKADSPHARIEDKLIAWWTKGKYSHVEIFVPETKSRYTSSGRAGGVVKRVMSDSMMLLSKDDRTWDYVELDVPNNFIDIIESFYSMTKNDKYDWATILGFIIPFRDRTNRWVCSEWCANVGKISFIRALWKLNPAKLSPNGLFNTLAPIARLNKI